MPIFRMFHGELPARRPMPAPFLPTI